jgi:tRNA wybutosine-synthesizing protein 1
MTPTLFHCTMRCLFCWRAQSGDLGIKWNETPPSKWDAPEDIVKEAVQAQLKILSGYKGNRKTNQEKLKQSLTPRHVAISLTGEPTLYSPLDDLIQVFHKQAFTTFVVSNGTVPEALSALDTEPTQLYISVSACDERRFLEVCRPQIPAAWKKLNTTLSLLPSFECPTTIRITLARNLNLEHPEQYARLIAKANPTYIEPKAYMHVGFSRLRLGPENMPTHREISRFAALLAKETGYNILDESPESRVVLLSRLNAPLKLA